MADPVPYVDIPLAGLDLNPFATGYIDGDQRTQQALTILFQTGLGEYLLDNRWGLDFVGWAQFADTVAISVRIRSLAQQEPGVASVDACTVVLADDNATLNISVTVTFTSGTVATGSGTVPGIGPISIPWTWTLVRGWHG